MDSTAPDHSPELPAIATRAQVAEYLQVTIDTVDRWRYEGKGPRAIKLARSIRYRREDVMAYLAALAASA